MNNKDIRLLSEFALRVKAFLLRPAVDKILKMKFDKTCKDWRRPNEKETLNYEGRMTALLAAQNQSKEIQRSEKGKVREPWVNMIQQQQYNSVTATSKKPSANTTPNQQN
ncbi:hypothetical protein INT46_007400 [Mucor plumbeus]|uniref:Uncharacterized protein n=1 Tax=Mucor plumbeus TaxID=97098 RepID=A0A8H7VBM6_9FUNG|nr:hypothetical protein INT46_007400 [Mucor plumbeus]